MEDVVLVVLFSVLRFLDALGILAFINCWKEQMRKRREGWIARRLWMGFITIKLRIWKHVLNESISSYLYMRYIWTGIRKLLFICPLLIHTNDPRIILNKRMNKSFLICIHLIWRGFWINYNQLVISISRSFSSI